MNKLPKNSSTNSFLSIIILNYNSGDYLQKCLTSIHNSTLDPKSYEVIIVDNNSDDGSVPLAQKLQIPNSKYQILKTNNGFAHGNNQGVKQISPLSTLVMFLNPDTIIEPNSLSKLLHYFDTNPQVYAVTPKIILAKTGQLQPECHRGFPTPLRSFFHFSKIAKLFPYSSFFNGYFQGHLNTNTIHPVEAGLGACMILRREVGNSLKWWDEDYFMYGEDIQLSWDLWHRGYNLYFVPEIKITHFQGISSGYTRFSQKPATVAKETKRRSVLATTQAMRVFFQKNLAHNYPKLFSKFIVLAINLLEQYRLAKI